jgi:hypothetical protein
MQDFYNFMREKSEIENVSILETIKFYLKVVKDIKKGNHSDQITITAVIMFSQLSLKKLKRIAVIV